MRKLILISAVLLAVACGKKGDPSPPVPVIPKGATDLAVTQRGAKVVLSWSYPVLSTAGRNIGTFKNIVIYRHVEALPATLAGKEAVDQDPSLPREIALFSQVTPLQPQQFTRMREMLVRLPFGDVRQFTRGSRIVFEDLPPMRSEDGRPVRLTYAVATDTELTRGEMSNMASIVPLEPAAPPTALTARTSPSEVVLEWTAPATTISGKPEPTIIGYNIFRLEPTGSIIELPTPINSAPVSRPTFSDTPPFGPHRYLVTAVASSGPPPVQSEPTPTVFVEFADRQPPPAPASVAVLIEESAVRLVWEPVEAADFAGYRVYRGVGAARTRLTNDLLAEPRYLDPNLRAGEEYVYSVTSVDRAGNESAPATAAPVLISR